MPLPAKLPRCRYASEEISSYDARREAIASSPELSRAAWLVGQLWWLLDLNQYRAYVLIRLAIRTPFARFVLNWARRTGKTFLLLVIVVEECIRHRGHRYNVAAATKESLKEFVWPALELIFTTCPEDLRPHLNESRGRVTFKRTTKSFIVLAGCNDARSVERLRGPFSHGNIIEEMGTIPSKPGLVYILRAVLNPQLKSTRGWTLMAMTPPSSAGHASANIALHAEALAKTGAEGHGYDYCTTFDCPRYTEEEHLQYMESDARLLGLSVDEYILTTDFRREWLAIIETDPTLAVLPAFTNEKAAAIARPGAELPASSLFVDRYDAMDIGFSPHWTALLYAHWSFERQRLRLVGERVMRRMGTPELAEAVAKDEATFHGKQPVFLRVADNNNPILLKDLSVIWGLLFVETAKDNLRAAVADVNRWIADGTIEIDETACPMLVAQMKAAVWDAKGREFAETLEFGHFDLVAALVYLVRNVIPNINRMPRHWGKTEETHLIRHDLEPDSSDVADMFDAS